jgi:hypothetical protein
MTARYPRNRAATRNNSDRRSIGTIVASKAIVIEREWVTLI